MDLAAYMFYVHYKGPLMQVPLGHNTKAIARINNRTADKYLLCFSL